MSRSFLRLSPGALHIFKKRFLFASSANHWWKYCGCIEWHNLIYIYGIISLTACACLCALLNVRLLLCTGRLAWSIATDLRCGNAIAPPKLSRMHFAPLRSSSLPPYVSDSPCRHGTRRDPLPTPCAGPQASTFAPTLDRRDG